MEAEDSKGFSVAGSAKGLELEEYGVAGRGEGNEKGRDQKEDGSGRASSVFELNIQGSPMIPAIQEGRA